MAALQVEKRIGKPGTIMKRASKNSVSLIWITIVVVAAIGFAMFGCSSSVSTSKSGASQTTQTSNVASSSANKPQDPDANLIAQAPPENGAILDGYEEGYAGVEVIASPNANAYVKVKDSSGNTVVGFFVNAGSTASVYVPEGTYSVQFAMGQTWYGQEDCFGSQTSYGKDDNLVLEYGDIVTYTLQLSTNGNFTMSELDANEF